jgi:hypothetical protein
MGGGAGSSESTKALASALAGFSSAAVSAAAAVSTASHWNSSAGCTLPPRPQTAHGIAYRDETAAADAEADATVEEDEDDDDDDKDDEEGIEMHGGAHGASAEDSSCHPEAIVSSSVAESAARHAEHGETKNRARTEDHRMSRKK